MSDDKVVKLPVVRIERGPERVDKLAEAIRKSPATVMRGPEANYTVDAKLQAFTDALREIARGRCDTGRAMPSERARRVAQEALATWGMGWGQSK
jgi:ABC-type nitrate/sulfonate/bicarbonate transport system substrate-binding protein